MSEIIHEFAQPLRAADGTPYQVQVHGEPDGHVWYGWLTFVPLPAGVIIETDRETTQPSREALSYWATGLEPIYLEGAFGRAARDRATDPRRSDWPRSTATAD